MKTTDTPRTGKIGNIEASLLTLRERMTNPGHATEACVII